MGPKNYVTSPGTSAKSKADIHSVINIRRQGLFILKVTKLPHDEGAQNVA